MNEEKLNKWALEVVNQEGYSTPNKLIKAYDIEVRGV